MQPDFRRPHEPSRRPATLDPLRRRGGVVTQRPAKPFTPVRFRSAPLLGDTRFCGSCSPSLLAVADRPGTEMVRYLIRRLLWAIVTMIVSLVAISAPIFWLGLVALFLFSNDIGKIHIFDGAGTYVGLTANPGRWFGSLILPWLVLAASLAAFYARLLRSQLIEAMSQDYIRTARAKGLREPQVIWRHGVRAAITPIVTALGIDIGVLLGGAVLVETVFAVPGVGYLAYQGIQSADLPIIQGTVQLGAFFIVIA